MLYLNIETCWSLETLKLVLISHKYLEIDLYIK